MVTINNIRKFFSDFADNHYQIKDFGYGDLPDISMEMAQTYPLLWVQPLPWTINDRQITFKYSVFVADRVFKEKGLQLTEVHSDTAQILWDLMASMDQQQDYEWILEKQSTGTPFTDSWKDEVSGHFMDLAITQDFNYNECQIPMSGQPDPPPGGDCAEAVAVLKDSAGTTLSTTSIASGASSNITAPDGTLTVNSAAFTTIKSNGSFNLPVKDTNGTSVGSKVGSDWIVPAASTPSGVLLKWPLGSQYTSFRTGDEGWRMQNGYFDYTPPAYPQVIADIDRTIGQNGWLRLKSALKVGLISSVIRFVDVDGDQVWGATDNKDKITIDKLTGIGFYRVESDIDPASNWNTAVDNALAFSVVVAGVTYSNWYLASMEEFLAIFYHKAEQASGHIEDLISVGNPDIFQKVGSASESWTSTTQANSAGANAYSRGWNPEAYFRGVAKSAAFMPFYVFDARNLITAP